MKVLTSETGQSTHEKAGQTSSFIGRFAAIAGGGGDGGASVGGLWWAAAASARRL